MLNNHLSQSLADNCDLESRKMLAINLHYDRINGAGNTAAEELDADELNRLQWAVGAAAGVYNDYFANGDYDISVGVSDEPTYSWGGQYDTDSGWIEISRGHLSSTLATTTRAALHEIGHAVGLDYTAAEDNLMSNTSWDSYNLTAGQLYKIHADTDLGYTGELQSILSTGADFDPYVNGYNSSYSYSSSVDSTAATETETETETETVLSRYTHLYTQVFGPGEWRPILVNGRVLFDWVVAED